MAEADSMQPANEPPPGYGEDAADVYDAEVTSPEDMEACIDALATLAGTGPALELGVGTGRVAIPLAQRCVTVHGIDESDAMLQRLRGKPGGTLVRTFQGDCAALSLNVRYTMIFVVFDTITALQTQERQVQCFERVAGHLKPGGVFVVEASIPDRSPRTEAATGGHSLLVKSMEPERVQLEANWHDAVNQRIYTQWIFLRNGSIQLFPFDMRYAWPSELDLMARLAGLELRERWGGWRREEFTASSPQHVSLYARPAAGG